MIYIQSPERKKKTCKPRIVYLAKMSSRDGEIKSFMGKQTLREFITTRPALQEMLKGILQVEIRKCSLIALLLLLLSSFSRVRLCVTLWTAAHQAPQSLGFSRQEFWSGLPFPSPRDLPDPEIKPRSPALQADASLSEPPGKLQH